MTLSNLDNTMLASLSQSTIELQFQSERVEAALVQQSAEVNNRIAQLTDEKDVLTCEIAKTDNQRTTFLQNHGQNVATVNKQTEDLETEFKKLKEAAANLEEQCTAALNEINRLNSPAGITQRAQAHANQQIARNRELIKKMGW